MTENEQIKELFSHYLDCAEAGELEKFDAVFVRMLPEVWLLTISLMLAPLSITALTKQFFNSRPAYFETVKEELTRRDPERVNALLQGL